ncbi:MAG: hypothetical protein GEU86_08895 [Actinophytocola sp.]|nr:hypothetical protein [Actinophytocola sp.]
MSPRTLDLPWPEAWHKRRWGTVVVAAVLAFVLGIAAFVAFLYGRAVGDAQYSVLSGGIVVVAVAVVVAAVILSKLKMPAATVETALVEVDGAATPGVRFPVKPPLSAAVFRASDSDQFGIDLTPEHVVVSVDDDREVMRWADIAKVIASTRSQYAQQSSSRVRNWIRIVGHGDRLDPGLQTVVKRLRRASKEEDFGRLKAEVAHTRLATDPLLVFHGLRFYLANPDTREELADARALTRLREGRVTT